VVVVEGVPTGFLDLEQGRVFGRDVSGRKVVHGNSAAAACLDTLQERMKNASVEGANVALTVSVDSGKPRGVAGIEGPPLGNLLAARVSG
jgi:hypothetical protein